METILKKSNKNKMEQKIKLYTKTFKGKVTKIVKPVATIEFEKTTYHSKFERFSKRTIKMKARIPKELLDKIKVGDDAIIAQCRPLSKTIHHMVKEVFENKKLENKPEKKVRRKK
jgi:ribosomal protein S17